MESNPEEVEPIITKSKICKGYYREKTIINLPEEDKVFTLAEKDKICLIDGGNLHYTGKKYIRSEILRL